MKQYAYIVDGRLTEVIPEIVVVEIPNGEGKIEQHEVALAERYHPDFIKQLVPYDDASMDAFEPRSLVAAAPRTVEMVQARLALLASGQLAAVSVALAALPSPERETAQIEWEFASTVERDSTLVQILATALNLDETALDALFATAARL